MGKPARELLNAGSIDEIKHKGRILVPGGPVPIALFYSEGKFHAVDNRCPHMGFPLHRGTIEDGILTCHWHHARFDLESGCTFDLFADDAAVYPVEVRDGRVFIDVSAKTRDPIQHGLRRLEEGMDQNIRLVIAKAVVALLHAGANADDIAGVCGLYGARRRRSGWGNGLTILTAMANVSDHLRGDERIAPLYQGALHVASDTSGQPPRISLRPLESRDIPRASLRRWFRYLVEVRNADGAERTLLTAIEGPLSQADLAEMMVTAATDHFYLDGGHVIDFINKAFELLDRIGWEHAADVLPSLIPQLSVAQRSEEQNSWRSPVDLVALLSDTFDSLDHLLEEGQGAEWKRNGEFTEELLQGRSPENCSGPERSIEAGRAPGTAGGGSSTGRGAPRSPVSRAERVLRLDLGAAHLLVRQRTASDAEKSGVGPRCCAASTMGPCASTSTAFSMFRLRACPAAGARRAPGNEQSRGNGGIARSAQPAAAGR